MKFNNIFNIYLFLNCLNTPRQTLINKYIHFLNVKDVSDDRNRYLTYQNILQLCKRNKSDEIYVSLISFFLKLCCILLRIVSQPMRDA